MAAQNYQEEALRQVNPFTGQRNAPSQPPAGGSTTQWQAPTAPTRQYQPTNTKLPSGNTSYKPGMGPAITSMATGIGADIAGQQVTNALTSGASSPAWATGAAGMGAGMGISMAGNYLANKKKPKELMPTYGGRHGAITDGYGRRFEGAGPGVEGGAIRGASYGANPALAAATGGISIGVGALAGAIAGGATKNDPEAFRDFSAGDGYDAIGRGYKDYLGRDASEEEIMTHMRNVGYKPEDKHRWLGQDALYHILDTLQDSEEAQRFRGELPPAAQAPSQEPTASQVAPGAQRNYPGGINPPAGNRAQISTAPVTPYDNTPGSDIGPTTTFADGSVMATTNKQNEDTLARQPANTQRLTGNPSSTPAAPSGPPALGRYRLEGFDQGKLDSGHDSPKYQIGRTLSNFDPRGGLTPEALEALNKLGIGTFSGTRDKLRVENGDPRFNGLSEFDVVRDFDGTGDWQFAPDGPSAQSVPGGELSMGNSFSNSFGGQQFSSPQGSDTYSDQIIRYLMNQLALDQAATSLS
jgi:hypothetical protein